MPLSSLRHARVAFTGKLAALSQRDAQAVVTRAGGVPVDSITRRTSVLVVGMCGWPLLRDGRLSAKLQRAEALNRDGLRVHVISEQRFLELAGLRAPAEPLHKRYTAAEISRLLGLDAATLRRWEQLSLIRSTGGRFDFQDITSLRTIADLIGRGVQPGVIAQSLHGLGCVLPSVQRPLAQLNIVQAQPDLLLAELDEYLVAADGQLFLKFEREGRDTAGEVLELTTEQERRAASAAAGAIPTTAARGRPRRLGGTNEPSAAPDAIGDEAANPEAAADAWFDRAEALEEDAQLEDAAAAYRHGLALAPARPAAHFNLGNVLRELEDLPAAAGAYEAALRLDPGLACAWYNLSDVRERLGLLPPALEALQAALRADPLYADAIFNLACLLEQSGAADEAEAAWRRYLQLDPHSDWADTARRRLAALGLREAPAGPP